MPDIWKSGRIGELVKFDNKCDIWLGCVLGPDWPVLVPVVDLDGNANNHTNDVEI